MCGQVLNLMTGVVVSILIETFVLMASFNNVKSEMHGPTVSVISV